VGIHVGMAKGEEGKVRMYCGLGRRNGCCGRYGVGMKCRDDIK
jgi:hypothetical protein